MEITRLFLFGALFLIGFMLWNTWENESTNQIKGAADVVQSTPLIRKKTCISTDVGPGFVSKERVDASGERFIHVKTDVLDVFIDTQGGNIVRADLLKYPQYSNSKADSSPFQLLSESPFNYYVTQSGLLLHGKSCPMLQCSSQKQDYALGLDKPELDVYLNCPLDNGLSIQKQFIFKKNDYLVLVRHRILNRTGSSFEGQIYNQLSRKRPVVKRSLFNISSYVGGAVSTPDKPYQKISFDKMREDQFSLVAQGGWIAMLQHYFLSAWIPSLGQQIRFYSYAKGDIYTLGALSEPFQIRSGEVFVDYSKLYLGPEILDRLKMAAPHLDLTVDYGILWFISIGLFWLLKQVHRFLGNWGWSIVVVTVLIKLAFYHLSAKSYRSMAGMRNLQPRLEALKERYVDDKQKLTQAMMELYRTEKINPLGGCLPTLVQIPVFIALYWMLLESVELRQAPFILWIHDLSIKDPYYILPILMGITMFFQQRLNPPPPDPVQAKVIQFLPVFFTALFLNFPAGLVLYWVVNNTLSILQQWLIVRRMSFELPKKKY